MITDLPRADRNVVKGPDGHDHATFTMQGMKERDQWMRIFPYPIPETHEMKIWWEFPLINGQQSPGVLHVQCVPRPNLPKPEAEKKPDELTPPATETEARRVQLMGWTDKQLAERSVEIEVHRIAPYRGSKAQRVALILKREQQIAAEKAKGEVLEGAGNAA